MISQKTNGAYQRSAGGSCVSCQPCFKHKVCICLELLLVGVPLARPACGSPASGNAAQTGVLVKPSCIGTQVGVSTYSDDPLYIRTDTDESRDEHHTRYGVGTGIRGDNGVFGASGARADAPAVLLGAYQGASQSVFQPAYMGHPMAYSGLNGQTHDVGSDYCKGVPSIAGVPISAPVVTLVLTRALKQG